MTLARSFAALALLAAFTSPVGADPPETATGPKVVVTEGASPVPATAPVAVNTLSIPLETPGESIGTHLTIERAFDAGVEWARTHPDQVVTERVYRKDTISERRFLDVHWNPSSGDFELGPEQAARHELALSCDEMPLEVKTALSAGMSAVGLCENFIPLPIMIQRAIVEKNKKSGKYEIIFFFRSKIHKAQSQAK